MFRVYVGKSMHAWNLTKEKAGEIAKAKAVELCLPVRFIGDAEPTGEDAIFISVEPSRARKRRPGQLMGERYGRLNSNGSSSPKRDLNRIVDFVEVLRGRVR
jgi:hypothetical protein